MPVSTGEGDAARYGDPQHFAHVLDHLFAPAVQRAGFELVPPVMQGADLIHAEIVRNLETAELVLCDATGHNPNVFFELGIRTALDRPVALVRDNLTERLPFDTSGINTHTYDSSLAPWTLEQGVERLSEHLRSSSERSRGANPLWSYFGLTRRASEPSPQENPLEARLDLILARLESNTQELAPLERASRGRGYVDIDGRRFDAYPEAIGPLPKYAGEPGTFLPPSASADLAELLVDVAEIASQVNARLYLLGVYMNAKQPRIVLATRGQILTPGLRKEIAERASMDGFAIEVRESEF